MEKKKRTCNMFKSRWCNFEHLAEITTNQISLRSNSIHGASHWKRVERNGLHLSAHTGADVMVVRLFAWFHDARRQNDRIDPGHGRRGADYAAALRRQMFDLEEDAFEKLVFACTWHTDQILSTDPTIGTCWDADRLDLGRAGITPSVSFMSTAFGKELVRTRTYHDLR